MLFNFMTNLGPNAQTYLLAGEVFPTAIRGKGAGFAAAFAKIGAVAPRSCSPSCSSGIGTQALLYGLIVTSILGAVVTWLFRIETTGVSLDSLNSRRLDEARPRGSSQPTEPYDPNGPTAACTTIATNPTQERRMTDCRIRRTRIAPRALCGSWRCRARRAPTTP